MSPRLLPQSRLKELRSQRSIDKFVRQQLFMLKESIEFGVLEKTRWRRHVRPPRLTDL